jgi:PIN domain nuclease of toxin-antitoxin system
LCDAIERDAALLLLPLDRGHVNEARALPTLRDPFDRLIAGSAIGLGVPLISPDPRIAASGRLQVVW